MLAAQLIQLEQQIGRRQTLAIDRHRVALLIADDDLFGLIRRIFRRHAPAPHVFFRAPPRVFQTAAFVGDVQQVGVHRIRRFFLVLGEIHRNAVGFRIAHQLFARVQIPLAPRSNHFHPRLERISAQLEAHLVVALAGRAVGDGIRTGFVGDFHQALGDQRTRNRGAQQVLALVERIGTEHREDEITHEFLAHVLDENILHPHSLRLGASGFDFLALPQVGGKGHHLALILFLQPFQNH